MILLMNANVKYQCDAIRINLLPQKIVDNSCSIESIEEVVRSARQVGSYIVTLQNGIVGKLIDPNTILAIVPDL